MAGFSGIFFARQLARRNGFLPTSRTGGIYDPLVVSPLLELELRVKKMAYRPLRDAANGIPI